ncbi:GGDEF domain-containing protein [Derxia gummosa]|uniref:GGDEF domain-containing protein n=1 Tax=Derxia gummosa DSM 723 TaxID=1121388 RepID=A0A8B6XAQ2_9BURK|nr:GGDEF domain-containing protein [Derxia gummosa]
MHRPVSTSLVTRLTLAFIAVATMACAGTLVLAGRLLPASGAAMADLAITCAALLLGFAPAAGATARLFARPLLRLIDTLDARADAAALRAVPGWAEAEDLGACIAALLSELGSHHQELREINATLERRIDRRTAELSKANARLVDTQRRLTDITENVPALITYFDRDYRTGYANRMVGEWTGLDPAQIVGRRLDEFMPAAAFAARKPWMDRALTGERVQFTESWTGPDGETRFVDVVYVPHRDTDGAVVGLYGLSTDSTAVRRAEQALCRLARHDSLTGLPNRLALGELLPAAIDRGAGNRRGIALLFLDIDRFKQINDTLGHAAGDEVLREFGRRLRACVRAGDTVARLAGDEFVVALEGLGSAEGAERVAQAIVLAMREPMRVDGNELVVGTSIGIALAAGAITPEVLLADADRALYEVKRAGRGSWRVAEPLAHVVGQRERGMAALTH